MFFSASKFTKVITFYLILHLEVLLISLPKSLFLN